MQERWGATGFISAAGWFEVGWCCRNDQLVHFYACIWCVKEKDKASKENAEVLLSMQVEREIMRDGRGRGLLCLFT